MAATKTSAAASKRKASPKRRPAAKRPVNKGGDGYSRAAMEAIKRAEREVPKGAEQPLMKTLRAEHRHMATVMQLFMEQLKHLETGGDIDAHVLYEIMEYMVSWPDRYHHPREDLIYSRVAELDRRAADEVDTLQRDHDRTAKNGRALLRDIQGWQAGSVAPARIIKAGRAYVDHIYEHMNVEEKVVFPRIESVLTLDDWRELAEDDRLQAVSIPVLGPRVQREFRNLARRLRRRLRHTAERGVMLEWVGVEAMMESIEVLSLAYDSARASAGEHVGTAIDDARAMFREAPLTAPARCAVNNTRLGLLLAKDMLAISRDTFEDLLQVNRERRQRIGLLDR